jgi:hypothetical protein
MSRSLSSPVIGVTRSQRAGQPVPATAGSLGGGGYQPHYLRLDENRQLAVERALLGEAVKLLRAGGTPTLRPSRAAAVTLPWILAGAAAGLVAGPRIRASVFSRSTEPGRPPRRACPACAHEILPDRWRGR